MSKTDDTHDVARGAQAYRQRLGHAGGQQRELLLRLRERSAICVALYEAPPYDLAVPALPVARLSLNFMPARVSGGIDGERPRDFASERHSLFLTPAGAAVRWRKNVPSRHVNIYFHPEAFTSECVHDMAGTPLFNATLPGVRALADELAGELARDDAVAEEAVDSLSRLLLVRLARHAERRNPLTRQGLARLRDFVLAHLEHRLLVADLAAVAGLTPNRYAQAHLQLTGQPPHQFVLALRLQRAMELLALTTMPLAEVAATCGFASQQHLTHTMRRRLGTTPARWRREHQR